MDNVCTGRHVGLPVHFPRINVGGRSLSVSKGSPSINPDECRDTRETIPAGRVNFRQKIIIETSGYSGTRIVRRSSSVALDTLLISFEPLEERGYSGTGIALPMVNQKIRKQRQ
jgi:hypothetical protein